MATIIELALKSLDNKLSYSRKNSYPLKNKHTGEIFSADELVGKIKSGEISVIANEESNWVLQPKTETEVLGVKAVVDTPKPSSVTIISVLNKKTHPQAHSVKTLLPAVSISPKTGYIRINKVASELLDEKNGIRLDFLEVKVGENQQLAFRQTQSDDSYLLREGGGNGKTYEFRCKLLAKKMFDFYGLNTDCVQKLFIEQKDGLFLMKK